MFEDVLNSIEDSQYITALQSDECPKPSKAWVWPTDKELDDYRVAHPEHLALEHISSQSLGFYLFCDYLHSQGDGMKADFLCEVAKYRKTPHSLRYETAKRIFDMYLSPKPPSEGQVSYVPEDSSLARICVLKSNAIADGSWPSYIKTDTLPNNSVGIVGNPLKVIRTVISECTANKFRGLGSVIEELNKGKNTNGKRNSSVIDFVGKITQSSKQHPVPKPSQRRSSLLIMFTQKVGPDASQGITPRHPSDSRPSSKSSDHRSGPQTPDTVVGTASANLLNKLDVEDLQSGEESHTRRSSIESNDSSVLSDAKRRSVDYTLDQRDCEHGAPPPELFDTIDSLLFAFLQDKHSKQFFASSQYHQYLQFLQIATRPVHADDFTMLRVLGRGGFGLVCGCMRQTTGKVHAMKAMSKRMIKLKRAEGLCLNERKIMEMLESPFVVSLRYALTNPNSDDVLLVLDLMSGGDLRFHLRKAGTFSLVQTKYYAVRTALGIGALHEQNIAYRDLKPENVLMSETGETKLSDFGLATEVSPPRNKKSAEAYEGSITGMCGTRGYMAPEMYRRDKATGKRKPYTESIDWFAFGCCIVEFMTGDSPFNEQSILEWSLKAPENRLKGVNYNKSLDKDQWRKVTEHAMEHMEPVLEASVFDDETRDFCLQLLCKDGSTRLGAGPNGYWDVLRHPWFQDVDVPSVQRCTAPPPFVPSKDVNMMNQSDIGKHAEMQQCKAIDILSADHEVYRDWNFVSIPSFQSEVVDVLRSQRLNKEEQPFLSDNADKACCVIA